MELFQFAFMQRAFAVGLTLAVIVPAIGMIVVFKRLSMIGDALSHASLAGVAAGLLAGFNPVAGSVATCLLAALGIEAIRKRLPRYQELAIALVMSAGIGLAGVLSGWVSSAAGFASFLFGSIVAISPFELALVLALGAVVLLFLLLLYKELFFVSFDERAARLAGVPVGLVNIIFTVLTAITVAIASRTVGALIVSSLMVVPVACAMQVARSYKQTLFWSMGFGVLFVGAGMVLSYEAELKPGGAIVLLGLACFVLLLGGKALWRGVQRARRRGQGG